MPITCEILGAQPGLGGSRAVGPVASQPTLGPGLQDSHLMGELEESQRTGSETGPSPQPEGRALPECPQVDLDPTWPWTTALPAHPSFIWPWAQPQYLPSLPLLRGGRGRASSLWAAQEACQGKGLIGALQVSTPELRVVLERGREKKLPPYPPP